MSATPPPTPNTTAVIQMEAASGATFSFTFKIKCPSCGSAHVVKNGTRFRESGPVQYFECLNPNCPDYHSAYPKHGKSFNATTSGVMKELILKEIQAIYEELYCHGTTGAAVARDHCMSDAWVSFLRTAFDASITSGLDRDKVIQQFHLLPDKVQERAASIDETFFKIRGITIYVIIVRGYLSRKVLGIYVSFSRKEADMKEAFEEAQQNCTEPIAILTADAWGATEVMVRHLNRPMTLIMHRHKKPYTKAVIERIEYEPENNLRIITQIGVPTDIFCQRGDREIHYLTRKEPMVVSPKRPRGRPKGSRKKNTPSAPPAQSASPASPAQTPPASPAQTPPASLPQNPPQFPDPKDDQKKKKDEKASSASLPSENGPISK